MTTLEEDGAVIYRLGEAVAHGRMRRADAIVELLATVDGLNAYGANLQLTAYATAASRYATPDRTPIAGPGDARGVCAGPIDLRAQQAAAKARR